MISFLPISLDEGKIYYRNFSGFDVIFVSGDPYYDHPLSGTAILSKLLDKKGFKVGVIPQPLEDEDYLVCGRPKYFFCITSGLLDSMLSNYTPMLKKRENVLVPERALIIYTQKIKQLFKGSMTIIGGVEATIRRFTHFDYKENKLRKGILNDSKADLLLFSNAERSILNLLNQMKKIDSKKELSFEFIRPKLDLDSIEGLAYRIRKEEIKDTRIMPSFEECVEDKKKFSLLTRTLHLLPDESFIEPCGSGYIKHNIIPHPLTEKEMDYVYSLDFTRGLHPKTKNLEFNQQMVGNLSHSVIIGRGCWGTCNFCIIPLVQGKNVSKRSKEGILKEVEFYYSKGVKKINDLTIPTLNMYGSFCELYNNPKNIYSPILEEDITVYDKTEYCDQNCPSCVHRKINDELIDVLEGVEKLNKKYNGTELELRSAVRHDIILKQKKLFRKIMLFISRLKIAPEHISDNTLEQMNKGKNKDFVDFIKEYNSIKKDLGLKKNFVPYFVAAHPGTTIEDMKELKKFCDKNKIFSDLTQIFTPTPGTVSTSMYYTGENPITKKEVYVARTFREKKDQKNILMGDSKEEIEDENG
jgi:uncharacterized radical SAM protein YgiQ